MLLDLLLDLSRLESGRLELSPVRCDLSALVRGLAEVVELTSNRHRPRLNGPARLEGVWDAQRIEQVLRNLLANAVKCSPDGGELGVSLEEGPSEVVVRVRDQGIGLAAEECTRIFDRFYRSTAVRRLQGAGLGLYICQAIGAAHGERIWAESDGLGRGSTFCFVLPHRRPSGEALPRR